MLLERYKIILENRETDIRNDVYESDLKLSGLVVSKGERLGVYNRIYQEIFNLEWTENEIALLWSSIQEAEQIDDIILLHLRSRDIAGTLWLCAILFCVSFLSLWSSYYWFSSEPWIQAFSQLGSGEIIELMRTVLLIIGTLYFIGIVWKNETFELLKGNGELTRKWRKAFTIIGIFVFTSSLFYHLFIGPQALQERYPGYAEEFKTYYLPYILYLPYTLINYNFLALLWVAVSSYGAVKDLTKNLTKTNSFIEKLVYIEELYKGKLSVDNSLIEEIVQKEFTKFSTNLITLISRYTILFISIGFIALFEIHWGMSTLSEKAKNLMMITYVFNIMAIIIILWVFYHYHVAFRKASICLYNLNCNDIEFENKNSFPALLKRILNSHFNLYFLLGIAVSYILFYIIFFFVI